MKKTLSVVLALLFVLCLLIFDVYFLEPDMLVLKRQNVYSDKWTKNLDGYKIGVISDLHIGTYRVNQKKLQKTVRTINAEKPDLIVLLGDLDAKSITQKKYSEDEIAKIFSELKAKDGVIAILGNHDFDPPNVVKNIYQKAKIPVLENTETIITHNGKKIQVVGLKDWWHNKYNPNDFMQNRNYPVIVLSHNPDVFPKIPSYVSITLSGHTHGGEIYLPLLGSPFVPSEYGQRYRKGRIIENGQYLYVSGGVASLSRLRFLNPPEIAVITMYAREHKKIRDTKVQKGFSKNHAGIFFEMSKKI
ncbi:MAG: metallophosphoesterase, partial [Candidatus Gastranaerophilales bacterium]|nr:metallophosphoesterase [Candidatus Gastranaerophilales bacterium]